MTTTFLSVFLICLGAAWFGKAVPARSHTIWDTRKPNLIGFFIAGTVLLLFCGLRNNMGDTPYYVHLFELAEQAGNPFPNTQVDNFLFEFFYYIPIRMGWDSNSFIFLTSCFFIIPTVFIFRKYSPDFYLAFFFLFTTGIVTISLNGIRQFVATGIVLLGTKYFLSEKKMDFLKFLCFVFLAYFVHTSVLVMIPIYFVCRRKAWSASTFMIIIAGVAVLLLVSLFFPSFVQLAESGGYSQYGNEWFDTSSGGASILRVGFHTIPMFLSFIYRRQLKALGPVTDIFVNLSVVHFSIFIISLYDWIFARFAFYTYVYMCILLSVIFSKVLNTPDKTGIKYVLYAAFMYYFWMESSGMYFYRSDFYTPNSNIWLSFLY